MINYDKFLKRNMNNIDFEKIESEIKDNIEERRIKFEGYNDNIDDLKISNDICNKEKPKKFSPDLSPYWDIRISRNISSHRPIIGNTLIKARKFLDDEIRRSIDPVIDKQVEFNRRIMEEINNKLEEINKHI